jgi:mannose-1-phosphate guanylyltransferase
MKILILAGGSGTRLWPASRVCSPKQNIPLLGSKTLLQDTHSRFVKGFKKSEIFVSLNVKQKPMVKNQLPHLPESQFIMEPVSKNTAAAIGLACVHFARTNPKAIVATINSDHFIKNQKEYTRIVKLAGKAVSLHPEKIVLIGIQPAYPETGYGYIHLDKKSEKIGRDKIFKVKSFKEKPDIETAKKYLKDKDYYWNPGYFIFRVDTMLELFKRHLPEMYKLLMEIKDHPEKLKKLFLKINPISLDYGIIEKTSELLCVPAGFSWADVGHWRTVYDVLTPKPNDNLIKGQYFGLESQGNLIYSLNNKLIALVGINDLVIVDTKDALLLCPKDRAQDVKKIVEKLKEEGLVKYL